MKSPTRAGGFVWKYSPLSECCNDNLFRHAATTADTVIPCSGMLADRPPSLLPFPIDGRGQPLFSPKSTSSHTDQVPIDEDSEAIFEGQNTGSPAVKGNGILHTPVSPHLPHSSSFSPFRRSDPHPSLTSTRFDGHAAAKGLYPRLPHSSSFSPFRRSDPHPSLTSTRFDGRLAAKGLYPRLPHSSSFSPFRRSDPHPSLTSTRFDGRAAAKGL